MQGDPNTSGDQLGLTAPGQTPSSVPRRIQSGKNMTAVEGIEFGLAFRLPRDVVEGGGDELED